MLKISGTVEQAESIIYDFMAHLNRKSSNGRKLSWSKYPDKIQMGKDKPPSRYKIFLDDEWIGLLQVAEGKMFTQGTLTPSAPMFQDTIEQLKQEIREWYDAPYFAKSELAPTADETKKRKRRPELVERDNRIKKIKDKKPTRSYVAVAQKYNQTYEDDITDETVRNAYRDNGWTWQRADKIR